MNNVSFGRSADSTMIHATKPIPYQPSRVAAKMCAAIGYALLFCLFVTPALAQNRRPLHDSVPPAAFRGLVTGSLPATNRLKLAITLPLRNPEVLATMLLDLFNLTSANYHHWLTSSQFTEQFGSTPEDVQKVTRFAEKYGPTVLTIHSNRMVVDVIGPVGHIERAFNVQMVMRPHPTEKRQQYFGPEVEPLVEADVPVLDISGLDNFATIRSNHHLITNTVISNATGSSPGSGYMGNDLPNAYAPDVTLDDTGQNIGLFEFGTTCYAEGFTAYTTSAGIAPINLTYVLLNGISSTPSGETGEQCLDVKVTHAMALGATSELSLHITSSDPGLDKQILLPMKP